MLLDRICLEMKRRERPEPGGPIRREDTERSTRLRQHFAPLEDALVLERAQRSALVRQRPCDVCVPIFRGGFVVVVGIDRAGPERPRKPGNLVPRAPMQDVTNTNTQLTAAAFFSA